MDKSELAQILRDVQSGRKSVEEAAQTLQHLPEEDLGYACLDHHRPLRTGLPEVVYGEGKNAEQLILLIQRIVQASGRALATRVDADKARAVCAALPGLSHHPLSRLLSCGMPDEANLTEEYAAVVAAGTSDCGVAEEAALTLRFLGNRVRLLHDVGVAGIHRLLRRREILDQATVVIVVAGMEGALPSVVGGLVDRPVVAVPTSIGYGTGMGGFAALAGMLNSCAPGVAVVNIDNGFGAACLAAAIIRMVRAGHEKKTAVNHRAASPDATDGP